MLVQHTEGFHWDQIPVLAYKEQGNTFRNITRQVLYNGGSELPIQLRYFEIAPEGYSTLEKHEHAHLVWIARGSGHVLMKDQIVFVQEKDVVTIDSFEWHQFHADNKMPLGFLCLVNVNRDKPHLPTPEDLVNLKKNPAIADFIRS